MKVLYKRTNVDGRKPEVSSMEYGELAINYNANNPRLITIASDNTVVSFLPEDKINEHITSINNEINDLNDRISVNKGDIDTLQAWFDNTISDDTILDLWGGGNESLIIEFSIDGINYQAEEGMTWDDWIASTYNTDGFVYSNGITKSDWGEGYHVADSSETKVELTNQIVKGENYVKKDGCVVKGTKILMADGTEKNVEDVTLDDEILVWNFETGKLDKTKLIFTEHTEPYKKKIIYLNFSNNVHIGIAFSHCFYDYDLNKFIEITESNYKEFIGHKFLYLKNNNFTIETLESIEIVIENIEVYSFAPYKHYGFFSNGYLNAPGGIKEIVNPYPINKKTMSVDLIQLNDDVEKYGFFTYEEFCSEIGFVPELIFEAFNAKYFSILINKNITTKTYIVSLIRKYQRYWL